MNRNDSPSPQHNWATLLLCCCALAVTSLAACNGAADPHGTLQDPEVRPADPAKEVAQEVTLALVAEEETADSLSATLIYQRKPYQEGPRAIEVFLRASDNLRWVSVEPLEATEVADKELVVQEREPEELRVIVYASTNLNVIDTGGLARLEFTRTDPNAAQLDFVDGKVNFAPAAAGQSLTLSEPLVVGGR